ncbi:outer membrane beta-barrel protein [Geobacter grbiciae]|uniref:outer membrane beta-barrel protein n=1 Tax=Geobacter grbiciae TaxID=155042 RepID=UPI001C00A451|nr:outer membrane beta-barrel protein [Geobacter grbiciae]MBT1076731.1 outer membrane beta-barrel protein [Geobacter grbiciae]
MSLPCRRPVSAVQVISAAAALIGTALTMFPVSAFADDFRLLGATALQQEYIDNLFMSPDDRKSSFITTLSGGFEATERTERLDADLTLKLDQIFYTDESRLGNSLNQLYRGGARYRLTELLTLGASAKYELNNRPDQDIERTGLIVEPVTRHRQEYGSTANYILSETLSAALSYSYLQDDFNDRTNTQNSSHDLSVVLERNLSAYLPDLTGSLIFGYGNYQTREATDTKVEQYLAMAGVSWSNTELWKLFANLGASYTTSEFGTLAGSSFVRTGDHSWGVTGKAGASYRDEYTTGTLAFSQGIVPASGRTGASRRTGLTLDMSRRFTEELTGFLSTGFFLNRSDRGEFSAGEIDETTFNAGIGARYNVSRDFFLEARYGYARIDYGTTGQTAERNGVMMSLVYRYPFLEK